MKKLLVLLFALVLCLGLVACNPGTPTTSSNGQDNLEKAAAYVSALYKSEEKDKPVVNTADYDLLNSATGNGESFFVTWEIKKINEDDLDVAVLKTKENGTPYVEITYNLEYNTVATNDTPEGRALNRRTEIIITPKLDQFLDLIDHAPDDSEH